MSENKETPQPQPKPNSVEAINPAASDIYRGQRAELGRYQADYAIGQGGYGGPPAKPISPDEIQAQIALIEARDKAQRAQWDRQEKIRMAFELTLAFSKLPEMKVGEATALAIATVEDILDAFSK